MGLPTRVLKPGGVCIRRASDGKGTYAGLGSPVPGGVMAGESDRIAHPWARTPFGRGTRWPDRTDLQLETGIDPDDVDRWVTSACVLCSNGDGLDIAVEDGRVVGVRGRAVDRVNHGRVDPKDLRGGRRATARPIASPAR